jgi:hypothetical protein
LIGMPARFIAEISGHSTRVGATWTPRGAHLLLQIRAQALNDDLDSSFERWYPGLRQPQETKLAA